MTDREPFSVAARARSFSHAIRGVATLLASEHNARVHALATLAVVGLASWLGLPRFEWALLLLAIGFVWAAEAFNTAIEKFCDRLAPERHPLIEQAKDLAAAGVLFAALAAAAVGFVVLGPPLLARLG
jgi:diacylglycerol kinase (ATP)